MTYLEELETVIVKLHGCEAKAVETVHVEDVYKGRIIWKGDVTVFALTGNPRASRCYAWGLPDEVGSLEITAILEIPPVISPEMAVKVAIASRPRRE
jgi:hypothetical protein